MIISNFNNSYYLSLKIISEGQPDNQVQSNHNQTVLEGEINLNLFLLSYYLLDFTLMLNAIEIYLFDALPKSASAPSIITDILTRTDIEPYRLKNESLCKW